MSAPSFFGLPEQQGVKEGAGRRQGCLSPQVRGEDSEVAWARERAELMGAEVRMQGRGRRAPGLWAEHEVGDRARGCGLALTELSPLLPKKAPGASVQGWF